MFKKKKDICAMQIKSIRKHPKGKENLKLKEKFSN